MRTETMETFVEQLARLKREREVNAKEEERRRNSDSSDYQPLTFEPVIHFSSTPDPTPTYDPPSSDSSFGGGESGGGGASDSW